MRRVRVSARVRANRANAQRSTGPKTPAGKARASLNAVSHGLAAAEARQSSPDDVELLVGRLLCEAGHRFFGDGAALDVAARELAEAQLHLLDVRRVRRRYWERLVADKPERDPDLEATVADAMACGPIRLRRMAVTLVGKIARRTDPLKNLNALERYERRALARRKRAARDFAEVLAAGLTPRLHQKD